MSGGSWDYFYSRCKDVAEELSGESCPLRRAFGAHMLIVSEAMHAIEWVDSGDKGSGEEMDLIRKALGDDSKSKEIEVLLSDGRDVIDALEKLGVGI